MRVVVVGGGEPSTTSAVFFDGFRGDFRGDFAAFAAVDGGSFLFGIREVLRLARARLLLHPLGTPREYIRAGVSHLKVVQL